jgi:NADH:ubiquinone oxidoreductase subunit 6 (subunit J)
MQAIASNPLYQLILAAALGGLGVSLLLPRPRGRWVSGGVALVLCGMGVLAAFLLTRFGQPVFTLDGSQTDWVGSGLFWLFAAGAVGFGTVLVANRNPARGAIAFAFVILSSCGLFLLLAAPFLMAATVIIYAGAIIVTFLFVLMLSNVRGPSDENYRSREPLVGALAGYAFLGLILFTLHQTAPTTGEAGTGPEPPITPAERAKLTDAYARLTESLDPENGADAADTANRGFELIDEVLVNPKGGVKPLPDRLATTKADPRVEAFLKQTDDLRAANKALGDVLLDQGKNFRPAAEGVRARLAVYLGNGHLPARNVENLGVALYSEHLLAVEMAGTLLLVATVGAVAIAGRRRERKEVPA